MTVTTEMKSDAVALITMNRPEALNAFNGKMRADLLDALATVANNADVRVIVLTGAGRGFCAGADVTDVRGGYNVEDVLNTEYGAFLSVIQTCEQPVIAAINGPAAGIGMTTALTCDLKVMAEESFLMSAFANIALVPDGGLSWLLTQELGYSRAFEVAVEAEKIAPQKCVDLGLVNRVVPTGDVVENAIAWAEEISTKAPRAMAATKRAFRAASQSGLRNAAAYEAMFQRQLLGSEDSIEGISALMEKRKPVFKGR